MVVDLHTKQSNKKDLVLHLTISKLIRPKRLWPHQQHPKPIVKLLHHLDTIMPHQERSELFIIVLQHYRVPLELQLELLLIHYSRDLGRHYSMLLLQYIELGMLHLELIWHFVSLIRLMELIQLHLLHL